MLSLRVFILSADRNLAENIAESQLPPNEQVKPISFEKVKEDIRQIFLSHSDIQVRRMSYGTEVILIGLTALLIAFTIYTMIWLVANNTIYDMTKHGYRIESVTYVDLIKILGSYYFWFGFSILIVPVGIYIFAFLIYFDMLYDSRNVEIIRLLTKDHKLKQIFFDIFWKRFQPEFRTMLSKDPPKKIAPKRYLSERSIRDTLVVPEDNIKYYKYKSFKKLALKSRRMTMSDLLGKVSMRMDESTIRGYFFAFTLLQIIVSVSFVAPALEFSQLGRIGTNLLSPSNIATASTASFLSFWAIEWAVFGAFVYSFLSLMDRIPRHDITPRYYLIVALRYIFAIALSSLFFLIYGQISAAVSSGASMSASSPDMISYGGIAALSFSVGMFPNRFFRMLGSFVQNKLGSPFSRDIGLEKFTGISANEATRLWEEGIENVDQLSDISVQKLYSKTKFDPTRLMELIGRALLWKFVFGLENMLVLLDLIEKPKDSQSAAEAEKRIEQIRSCRFTDIQGLCSYLFKKPFEQVELGPELPDDLSSLAEKINIPEEILVQVITKTPYFQNQLSFLGAEKGIQEVAIIELANLLDLPIPGTETEFNLISSQEGSKSLSTQATKRQPTQSTTQATKPQPTQSNNNKDVFFKWWSTIPEALKKGSIDESEEHPLLNQVNYVLVRLHIAGKHEDKPNLQQLLSWIRSGAISLSGK
jgi:hypothetical protein